jgi:hypothetical protein
LFGLHVFTRQQASPELNPNQINIMSKMLNADAQRFANECSEIWTKDVNKTSSGRLGSPAEGPGEALGLDKQLQCKIDNLIKIECKEDFSDAVLCRNSFADKYLGVTMHVNINH